MSQGAKGTTTVEAGNDVGRFILGEMNSKNLSMRDVVVLAKRKMRKPFSYEHLRKIVRGNTSPSVEVLEKVAKALDIDPATLLEMHHRSTITRKFGPEYLDTMNISPEMYEVDSLMKGLLPTQREMVIMQIKAIVQGNLASGKVAVAAPAKRKRAS